MPAPTTVEEFVELIRKSAVLDEPRVSAYIQKLKESGDLSKDLNTIAGLFVRDGLLTYFQAEQFLQGRWKRFNIGKYKVLERIGSGGMGQVFLCEHKLMRRRVAVKVLPTAKASDPSSLERFYREARAVAALDHQNIVRAYDIDQDDNLHFLVMEYVDGASLHEIVRKTGPMDPTRGAHYIYWSAIGLRNAHENGLIHRDIKPANILVDRQGVVKILDLGLARFFNDDDDMLTKKYDENVLGTADYLAPEQALDSHSVDGRADIYSLGATFYFMLTGHPPFTEGTVAQKLLWHQTRTPKPITDYRKDIAPELVGVIEKMMSKKPEDRYESPIALAEALLPFTQTPIAPPPDEEMPLLSLAAMSGVGGSSSVNVASRSMVTFAPRTPATAAGSDQFRTSSSGGSGSNPSVFASGDTKQTKTPTKTPGDSAPEPVAPTPVWESISADTDKSSRDESLRTTKKGRSSLRLEKQAVNKSPDSPGQPKAAAKARQQKLPLALLAGGGLILLTAVVILFFVIKGPSKPTTSTGNGGGGGGAEANRRIILTKNPNGQALHFSSLSDAGAQLKPGDQILIADDEWEETAALNSAKNVTLSGLDGKKVNWRSPATPKTGQNALLAVHNCEGIRISGINFNAGDHLEHCLKFSGRAFGNLVEDIQCSDAAGSNVLFKDCVADANRPFVVRSSRFMEIVGSKSKSAMLFETTQTTPRPGQPAPVNRDIAIRECRFDGPYAAAAIVFSGGMVNVSINNNKLHNATNGLLFRKARPEVDMQATISSNTFHLMKNAGIHVEDTVSMRKPANKIVVEYNFFVACALAAKADGDLTNLTFFQKNFNFRKTGVPAGNAELFPTTEINAELPVDPARKPFLYYDKTTSPLGKAGDGKPVGATWD